MVGGAQVDRAAQRLVEQRGVGDGLAVGRVGGAALGVEARPGADFADVVLGEELGVGHGDDDAFDVGVLRARL